MNDLERMVLEGTQQGAAIEIARLHAEVERLTEATRNLHASYCHSQEQFVESEKDNARLRAEVERLTRELTHLRAENERLRSAIRSALPHIHLYGNEGRAHDLLEAALGGGEGK